MIRATLRAALLALLTPILLNASHILKNNLLKVEVVQLIETMGTELQAKTGVNAYVIATNEHFPERYNLVEDVKQYETKISKPYVLFVFAPYAKITAKSDVRGRVGIIPSSDTVRAMYDYEAVRDAGIDIVAIKDSNTDEDKFNIGILQAYSELVDNIGKSKGVQLESIIPDEMGTIVMVLRVLIYTGTFILLWIFVLNPLWIRRKNGNE
jgi:hypothetical protein